MNTLILYDSQYGNTEQIAQAVAATLGSLGSVHTEHVNKQVVLICVNLICWCWVAQRRNGGLYPGDAVISGQPSPAALNGLVFACFHTRFHKPRWLTGSAARSMTKQLNKMGLLLLGPAESFFVQGQEGPLEAGELERAEIWALKLHDKIEQPAVRIYEN